MNQSQEANKATDTQLLARFKTTGDQIAFAELVRRHGPMVLATTRRVLSHQEDAEDAFQATMLALAKAAGKLREKSVVAGWLHKTAYSCAAELRRAGHGAIVFDAGEQPGGLNTHGVADYKMAPATSLAEVDWVLSHGIELRSGVRVMRSRSQRRWMTPWMVAGCIAVMRPRWFCDSRPTSDKRTMAKYWGGVS